MTSGQGVSHLEADRPWRDLTHGPEPAAPSDGDAAGRATADDRWSRARRIPWLRYLHGSAAVILTCVLVAAPLLFARLGRQPFDDPGEGMHAEIARELGAVQAPLRLTLNGVPYADKPPLLYALVAGASALAGPSEGAARTVSAVAALLAVVATAWLGSRLIGGAFGMLAGVVLLSCVGFFAYGRYLRPDSLFVCLIAVGWALMLTGVAEGRRWACGAGLIAFGAASLAKDPLGALAPPLTLGLASALGGRLRPLSRGLPRASVIVAGVLALGWWILAALATPGFGWYTLVDNHVLNVVGARHFPDEDIGLSALEFLAVALIGSVPWTLAAGALLWRLVRRRAWRDPAEVPWTALGLWVVGVLGVTALSSFRLPHYALPAYPGLALLAARAWRDLDVRVLAWAHAAVFALCGAACLALILDGGARFESVVLSVTDIAARKAGAVGAPSPMPAWSAFRSLVATTGGVMALGAVATLVAVRFGRAAAACVAVATMLATLPSVIGGLEAVASHRAVKLVALTIATAAGPGDLVAHEGPIENSGALEWYSGRRPVIVDGRRSVLGFGATRAGAGETFWDAVRLEAAWAGSGRVWLVTVRASARSVVSRLPGAQLVVEAGGRCLYVNR